jgi:hypothetical protein
MSSATFEADLVHPQLKFTHLYSAGKVIFGRSRHHILRNGRLPATWPTI